jgi:ATP-dependent DNA ligase
MTNVLAPKELGLPRREDTARFIEPMECLPVEKIPEGDIWTYELKLDQYRLVAVKTGGKVTLYSRLYCPFSDGTPSSNGIRSFESLIIRKHTSQRTGSTVASPACW